MVATLPQLEALLTPQGQALLARLGPDELPPDAVLRLGAALRRDHPPDVVAAAFTLHDLRLRARAKFARADQMWFTRAGLEQASSERTAAHRAARLAGAARIADLCCGLGGDLVALAAHAPTLAVDRDPLHLGMAALNAAVHGVTPNVSTLLADVRETDLAACDAAFVDPARRTPDRRLGPGRTEPPLEWCLALADRVPRVAVKAAPGLDLALVPPAWEAEFVADGRDLKEAVLWSPALAAAPRRATLLPVGHTLLPAPGPVVPVRPPGAYLLDPNPAVTRAGLVEDLARAIDAWKIDAEIAFLAADRAVQTPFARTLRVLDSLPWHERAIAAHLRALDVGAVDIRRRGLPGDVDALRRRLKLRGPRRVTLAMTRSDDRPWCLICTDQVEESEPSS